MRQYRKRPPPVICMAVLLTMITPLAGFDSKVTLPVLHAVVFTTDFANDFVGETTRSTVCSSFLNNTTKRICKTTTKVRGNFDEEEESYLSLLWMVLSAILTSIVNLYANLLKSHPLLTKSITSASIGALADVLAQLFELNVQDNHDSRKRRTHKIYFRRTFAVAMDSLLISGPTMHFAYDLFEKVLPVHDSWMATWIQVAADTFFLDPLFVLSMFVVTALVEQRPVKLQHYGVAVKTSWLSSAFLSPLQCVLFRIRLEYRVLAMKFQDVLWDATMSYMAHRTATTERRE